MILKCQLQACLALDLPSEAGAGMGSRADKQACLQLGVPAGAGAVPIGAATLIALLRAAVLSLARMR